jgi:hypothetical protein
MLLCPLYRAASYLREPTASVRPTTTRAHDSFVYFARRALPNAPVQPRAAQRAICCNRLLDGRQS